MSAASDYMEDVLLDNIFNGGALPDFGTLYIGLGTAAFSDDFSGSANEITGNSYARLAVVQNTGWDAASGGTVQNSGTLEFAAASGGDWGTITHAGLFFGTVSQAGTLVFHGALSASKAIADGDIFRFNPQSLSVAFD